MPVQTSYPGVYVQELPSGVHTIVGVGTSIAVFIGRAIQGPVDEPLLCLSYSDYVRTYSVDTSFSDLALQVQQFFMNGGSECYVLRIVNTTSAVAGGKAAFANAVLKNEANTATMLVLAANSPGASGNTLQCVVDYKTPNPESTFNLTVYTYTINAAGKQVVGTSEKWAGLTMNPASPIYAVKYLNQQSSLINAPVASQPVLVPGNGSSRSGRPIGVGDLAALLLTNFNLMISINGGPAKSVSLQAINTTNPGTVASSMKTLLGTALTGMLPAGVTVDVDTTLSPAPNIFYIIIRLTGTPGSDIAITPAVTNDLAAPMLFGVNQGGIERSSYANLRPAANGIVFNANDANVTNFAGLKWSDVQTMQVNGQPATAIPVGFASNANLMLQGTGGVTDFDGIRQKWGSMAGALTAAPGFSWTGQVWGSRLAILPAAGIANSQGKFTTGVTNIGNGGSGFFIENVSYYAFGIVAAQGNQGAGTQGQDGLPPGLPDYMAAFQLIDNEVDLFNLMILAKDNTTGTGTNAPTNLVNIWGPASAFCQQRRAMLLVDPPDSPDSIAAWATSGASGSQIAQNATDPSKGVNALRIGLVNDHSALYFPRIIVNQNNLSYPLAPSGTMAGVMARTDSNRGVWKAPAGTEANLIGITGLEVKFTDAQNGILNPAAVNTLRVFPDGIVSWGARTLDGDDGFQSQWKYIPVRRTALFIEESLYRGLKWVVFEPNDEPLWSQIRLNVGAFMHGLFIQGAFQGTKKDDAYFVACDSSTTTQNDINLGVVNIIVGFAPLKPAEFVVLSIQQMAGQIQV